MIEKIRKKGFNPFKPCLGKKGAFETWLLSVTSSISVMTQTARVSLNLNLLLEAKLLTESLSYMWDSCVLCAATWSPTTRTTTTTTTTKRKSEHRNQTTQGNELLRVWEKTCVCLLSSCWGFPDRKQRFFTGSALIIGCQGDVSAAAINIHHMCWVFRNVCVSSVLCKTHPLVP